MLKKKICMVGHFGVGKTSLVRRFVESVYDDRYLTTVGVKIDKKEIVTKGQALTLMLWDIAGKDDLADVKLSNLAGAHGYILVADGCRGMTLATAAELQKRITDLYGELPYVLAINKCDLHEKWEIQNADIEARSWTSFRTSAKSGSGVEEVFQTLADRLVEGSGE